MPRRQEIVYQTERERQNRLRVVQRLPNTGRTGAQVSFRNEVYTYSAGRWRKN